MTVLLDTDVCIDVIRRRPAAIQRFTSQQPSEYAISTVGLFEFERGTYLAADPERERTRVNDLLATPLAVFPFDVDAARLCARLDADTRSQRIGPRGLMTAAIAMVHDCPVATRNAREFTRVPGPRVEDWSGPA